MKTRINFDSLALDWVKSDTDVEQSANRIVLRQTYRLNFDNCKGAKCKRNCLGNLRCLSSMGGNSLLKNISGKKAFIIDDSDNLISHGRRMNDPAGLKNLGATCYLNSLLQVWFHNRLFRNAVFKWDRSMDAAENCLTAGTPSSVMGHLQLIFARLMYSPLHSVDPSSLIEMLGLDTGYQQDASECSGLLFNLIVDQLRNYPVCQLAQEVDSIFCGQQFMVISCENCGHVKRTNQDFYNINLNVQDSRDIKQCLKSLGKRKKIEGDFRCIVCSSSKGASTYDEFIDLPPILNIQLMRYSFDPKSGTRKKVKTAVSFPLNLDMAPYLKESAAPSPYTLKAVLVHIGNSASSGHYVAHVKINSEGGWFRLNDDHVSRIRGKLDVRTLDSSSELAKGSSERTEESESVHTDDTSPDGIPRLTATREKDPQGETLRSTSAYLLVYEKTGDLAKGSAEESPSLPGYLREQIDSEREDLQVEYENLLSRRKHAEQSARKFLDDFRVVHNLMPYDDGPTFGLVKSQTLSSILKHAESQFNKIRGSSPVTAELDPIVDDRADHEKIPPYLECPHGKLSLSKDTLTKMKVLSAKGSSMLQKFCESYGIPHANELRTLDLRKVLCRECVVARGSLHKFMKCLVERAKLVTALTKKASETGFWIGKKTLNVWTKTAEQHLTSKFIPQTSERPAAFNTELLCSHGKMNLSEKRIIPEECWSLIKYFFDDCIEFPSGTSPCSKCSDIQLEEKLALEAKSGILQRLRHDLSSIMKLRQTFKAGEASAFALDKNQAEHIRKYLRSSRADLQLGLVNKLLCDHGRIRLRTGTQEDGQLPFVLLDSEEWNVLSSHFSLEGSVTVSSEDSTWRSDPPACQVCSDGESVIVGEENKEFQNKEIPVYKIPLIDLDSRLTGGQNEINPPQKRQKLGRGQRIKGCRRIFVSSDEKFVDLKVKILAQHGISPILQKILLDDKLLCEAEGNQSLSELGITVNSVIFVAEDDQLQPDSSSTDENAYRQEFGFIGTKLHNW